MHPPIKSLSKLTSFRPQSSEHNLIITVLSSLPVGGHKIEPLRSFLDKSWLDKEEEKKILRNFNKSVCVPFRPHLPSPWRNNLTINYTSLNSAHCSGSQ